MEDQEKSIRKRTSYFFLFKKEIKRSLHLSSKKLEKKNIKVSANTVRRRLRERGLEFLSFLVKPLLTDKHQ